MIGTLANQNRTPDPAPRQPSAARGRDEIIQAARDLIPTLRERADQTDRDRKVPAETYRALQDAGFFHILKPTAYGGFEFGPHEHAMVTLELARGCASTAWLFSLLNADNIFVLSYPKEAQNDLWGKDTYATLAGSIFVDPQKAGATRMKGGYRLSGSFGFNSGCDHADWLVFCARVEGDDAAHAFLVPREHTESVDDWFTLGMRGTGSRTLVVKDVFVPEHRVILASELHSNRKYLSLHPTFDMVHSGNGFFGLHLLSAVAVGAAVGAVEYFAEHGQSVHRLTSVAGGAMRIADSDSVLVRFTESSAEADLARFRIENGSRLASERVRRRQPPDPSELAREARDNCYMGLLAMRSVDRLHALLGAKACFEGHPVARAMRDIHTATTHVSLNWDRTASTFAKAALTPSS